MTIIIGIAVFILAISIVWIWHNLGNIEKPRKLIFIVVGLVLTYLITLWIYHMANSHIVYPSAEIEKTVSNTLLIVFTGLNALIWLPFTANLFDKILEEEIEKKQAKKRFVILFIIFVICIFIEKGYLTSTQEGIINIYNGVQNAEK